MGYTYEDHRRYREWRHINQGISHDEIDIYLISSQQL